MASTLYAMGTGKKTVSSPTFEGMHRNSLCETHIYSGVNLDLFE